MDDSKRKGLLLAVALWLMIIGGAGAAVYYFVFPYFRSKDMAELVEDTGEDSQYRTKVRLRLDAFSGYAPLRSEPMKNMLRNEGIKFVLADDRADYEARLRALRDGSADMAVFTLDAFIQAGHDIGDFPATVVMIIDETKGADAVLAFKQDAGGIANVDGLDRPEARIVATPDSPSEFLARAVAAQFSLPKLSKDWLVGAKDGAAEVFSKMTAASGDEKKWAYVLWEPYVTKALKRGDTHVLIDSSKMKGYIVDVLVARRDFLKDHRPLVRAVVESLLKTTYSYNADPKEMAKLVIADAGAVGETLTEEEASRIVAGIQWKSTLENYAHFGLENQGLEYLEDVLSKIADVLQKTGAIKSNVIAGKEGSLFSKQVLADLKSSDFHPAKKVAVLDGVGPGTKDLDAVRADAALRPLTDAQWEKLASVGALQVKPLPFRRGTADLSELAQSELNTLARSLNSMPAFYMKIIGYARSEGDPKANQELAIGRARAVQDFLVSKGVRRERMREEVAPANNGAPSLSEVKFVVGQIGY